MDVDDRTEVPCDELLNTKRMLNDITFVCRI